MTHTEAQNHFDRMHTIVAEMATANNTDALDALKIDARAIFDETRGYSNAYEISCLYSMILSVWMARRRHLRDA